jgi:hypothetical protein
LHTRELPEDDHGRYKKMTTWRNVSGELIDTEKYIGFVYQVSELDTGMRYYGIKKFKRKIRRKPLKGKKRVRIDYVESDWETYNTSSPIMQKKLETNPDNYDKWILRQCTSVTEMKLYEAKLQIDAYLEGTFDELYNECINLRLRIRK